MTEESATDLDGQPMWEDLQDGFRNRVTFPEGCPFCQHVYTKRDLTRRRCQCMATLLYHDGRLISTFHTSGGHGQGEWELVMRGRPKDILVYDRNGRQIAPPGGLVCDSCHHYNSGTGHGGKCRNCGRVLDQLYACWNCGARQWVAGLCEPCAEEIRKDMPNWDAVDPEPLPPYGVVACPECDHEHKAITGSINTCPRCKARFILEVITAHKFVTRPMSWVLIPKDRKE